MSVTAQDVLNIVYALGDELDENGLPDDTTDLEVRTPGILTALQAELIRSGDLYSTYEIACKPATNLLGYAAGHDFVEVPTSAGVYEETREGSGGAKAYYFEVSDNATVYVEDYTGTWNTLATVVCAPTLSGYTAYKGIVTPTAGATKSRLRFTGSYRFIFTNYALFKEAFAAVGDIPIYRPWYKVEMPTDFKSVDSIVEEYPDMQYNKSSAYKWEGFKDLYVNYYYEGNIRIKYRPVPSVITALTDTMQLDDVTCRSVLPWGLSMELYKTDEVKFKYFQSRYREMKSLSMIKQPVTEQQIINLYGSI
jgi:hypothetical protein